MTNPFTRPQVKFDGQGLIPAVVQDVDSGAVIMLAYMNSDALRLTRETGRTHFWSRSRQTLWRKGETSGHEQIVHDVLVNCYEDSLLVRVTQVGPGCHTGHPTCFFRRLEANGSLSPLVDDETASRGIEAMIETWFGAYAFLRDNDLGDVSTTSRLLHSAKQGLEGRLADELVELAGVLRGTHRHAGLEADVILEASQSLYWLALISARERLTAAGWMLTTTGARSMDATSSGEIERAIETLVLAAEYWGEHAAEAEPEDPLGRVAATAVAIADAVRVARVEIRAVFEHDLADLRAKPYLAPYFASLQAASG